MLKPLEEATETGLIVDENLCVGCGNCVVVCPVHVERDPKGAAVGRGPTIDDPILRVEDGVVKVINMHAEDTGRTEYSVLCVERTVQAMQ